MLRCALFIVSFVVSNGLLSQNAPPNKPNQQKPLNDETSSSAKKSDPPAKAIAPATPAIKADTLPKPAGAKPSTPIATNPQTAPKSQPPAAKPSVNVTKLADAIQRQYNTTKSASFDFEQMYRHPFLTVTENSKGHVFYDKTTGNMVWNYLEPKQKQKMFFINGTKFTYFSVNDKVAYTHNCYDKDTLSAAITFLLGTGKLRDSFAISNLELEDKNPSLSWIGLVPKEKDSPVTKILLGVDQNARVVESIVEDPSGGKNHFKFSNFKTDPIAKSVFVFTPPEGVLVQPMPNVSCPGAVQQPSKSTPSPAPKTAIPERPANKK